LKVVVLPDSATERPLAPRTIAAEARAAQWRAVSSASP
jgi:hypothetical protein